MVVVFCYCLLIVGLIEDKIEELYSNVVNFLSNVLVFCLDVFICLLIYEEIV